jgi:uncharacterized protein with von Willebrand factor type A (vWA) domain
VMQPHSALDAESYLFDPPKSVWDRILLVDHATWFETQDLEVLRKAEEITRAYCEDIPREAWLGLYASANPLKPAPPQGMGIAHNLFQRAGDLPEWNRLRETVSMDPVAAAFGAACFASDLIDKLPPEVKDAMQAAQQARNQVQDLSDQLDVAQALSGAAGGASQGPEQGGGRHPSISQGQLQAMLREIQSRLAEAQAQAAAQEHAALQTLDAAQARTELSLARAMSDSADNLVHLQQAADEFGVGWGLGGSRGVTREQLAGLEELAAFIRRSPQVKMILDSLGWAKRLVTQERRKSKRGQQRFTHFKVQDLDLNSLAPDELVCMIAFPPDSAAYLDFLCRALDGDLLHAQFEGEEDAGRGPIVFLRDESGSMRGWRRATACALQLALMAEARREGRRFVSIPFSDVGEYNIYDPGPRPDPKGLLDHLETTYGNGTEPYAPLQAAIELIRTDSSLKAGDILCLTDGAFDQPSEDFLRHLADARRDPGLKVVAVVINGRAGQADFADKVVMVSDLVRDRDRLAEALAPIL